MEGWKEWNGMEWDGMGWNGMEWDGMGWNGMERDGTGWPGRVGKKRLSMAAEFLADFLHPTKTKQQSSKARQNSMPVHLAKVARNKPLDVRRSGRFFILSVSGWSALGP